MHPRGLICTLTLLGLAILGPTPGTAAPVTAADCAAAKGDWKPLVASRMHTYDMAAAGLKMQILLLDTDVLEAVLPALAADGNGFPTDPAAQATLVNAVKPQSDSLLIYLAARDRTASPTLWSPVFTVTRQSFTLHLTSSPTLIPTDDTKLPPVSFLAMTELKPMEPNQAWRALYLLKFNTPAERTNFLKSPGVLLEFSSPQKPFFLNLASLRDDIHLDADHPGTTKSRPQDQIELFFDHFPPKESASAADTPAAPPT